MENIITRIYELLKEPENLIEFEEQVQLRWVTQNFLPQIAYLLMPVVTPPSKRSSTEFTVSFLK